MSAARVAAPDTRRGLPFGAALVIAAAAGLVIGWLDLGATEPQPIAALLLVAGTALGVAACRGAWLVALVLALGVPTVHAALWALGLAHPEPGVPPAAVLVAMIPAMLGVAAGVGVRALTRG